MQGWPDSGFLIPGLTACIAPCRPSLLKQPNALEWIRRTSSIWSCFMVSYRMLGLLQRKNRNIRMEETIHMYLETPRMLIRNFAQSDVYDLHDILGDEETMEYCEPAYSLEKTGRFLKEFCIGRSGAVAAVQKEAQKVIGYILFHSLDDGIYEIGWFINRKYWRQGYAYEACSSIIRYAFEELNAHKIIAETIENKRSINLMEKLGMKLEGIQRSQVKDIHGCWTDLYLYGMLKKEHSGPAC